MHKNSASHNLTFDPVPGLVETRFRVIRECVANPNRRVGLAFEHRVDEAHRRARRLDEQIVRSVATSTPGLLAQLRLLSAFYDESTNGAGRRGTLLIQTIAAGIERLDPGDPLSPSVRKVNGADRS
jgi:hypothetical protein